LGKTHPSKIEGFYWKQKGSRGPIAKKKNKKKRGGTGGKRKRKATGREIMCPVDPPKPKGKRKNLLKERDT